MTNDPHLFRRRLALIGIGAVGVVGLVLVALWRSSPPPSTENNVRDISINRDQAIDHDQAKLLEEVHRKEREELGRYKRLSAEEKIDDDKTLSPEEKKREKLVLQKEMAEDREYEASVAEDFRELENDIRAWQAEQAKIPEKKKQEKANLRLVVETASIDLLPAQSLVANVHLINDGQEAVVLRTMLDSREGFLAAYVKPPGVQDYVRHAPNRGEDDGMPDESAPSLNSGSRWSFQTDLPLELGYDRSTNAVVLGEYRVRLELTIRGRDKVVADEFTVRVAAPTGDDETVRRQIFASGLHGFLGPTASVVDMSHLWAQSDENPERADTITKMFMGFCQVVPMVEDLCLRFPNSRYAPDLRAGFVRATMDKMDVLAPSPEAKIDLERRLRVMCQTMMDRDGPKSWVRAQILLLAADCAITVKGNSFTSAELLARFTSLCPTDTRTPGVVIPKKTGPEEEVDSGVKALIEELKEEMKKTGAYR